MASYRIIYYWQRGEAEPSNAGPLMLSSADLEEAKAEAMERWQALTYHHPATGFLIVDEADPEVAVFTYKRPSKV